MRKVGALGLVLGLVCAAMMASQAHAEMPAQDTVKGAKDHPLLSRFAGAKMVAYGVKEFDEVVLAASGKPKDGQFIFEKTLTLEGKHTRIGYMYPKGRSAVEVMRNYQSALDKVGMKTVFACAKEACGSEFGSLMLFKHIGAEFLANNNDLRNTFVAGGNEPRYVLASGTRSDGVAMTVGVYVVPPLQDYNGAIFLDIVEGKPMETGKVSASLNAADMAKGIAAEGKVAVYGVYFDTAKADVKPESRPALAEMAKMLQQDLKLKVYVIGHTDNQGEPGQNLALSQRRADAVVKALVDGYKVDARRLSPKGVASYAPLASNRAEAGRQKNRRVELVEQ